MVPALNEVTQYIIMEKKIIKTSSLVALRDDKKINKILCAFVKGGKSELFTVRY